MLAAPSVVSGGRQFDSSRFATPRNFSAMKSMCEEMLAAV